ncbi:hypothetical protein H9P43_006635 [Blastocladiella emersonii ATCC 22665]|nr:hypothetical protein H9P43_006635 [Blastocladiella emersonii ATCC 22665]
MTYPVAVMLPQYGQEEIALDALARRMSDDFAYRPVRPDRRRALVALNALFRIPDLKTRRDRIQRILAWAQYMQSGRPAT